MKSMVRYEEVASDPTAVWRIATAANHKTDMVQHQRGDFRKVMAEIQEGLNRVEVLVQRFVSSQTRGLPDLVPPAEVEMETTRRSDELRRINLKSTQEIQPRGAPEGNLKPPPTGLSEVDEVFGKHEVRLEEVIDGLDGAVSGDFGIPSWLFRTPDYLAPEQWNHQKPSQGPDLAKQWLQNPRGHLNPSQFQYPARQWNSNSSNDRAPSFFKSLAKGPILDSPEFVGGEPLVGAVVQKKDTEMKSFTPGACKYCGYKWVLRHKCKQNQQVNLMAGDVPDEAKFYLTQLDMVGRDDRWLWSTGLLWKPPPWPDFCAMGCDSVAQHGGYEVLVNFHSVKKYHISLNKASEFNDYGRSHQPPISLIKTEVCGLLGSVFCDFGPEITVLDVDGEDTHIGITASISNDNPALVSCVDGERLEFQDGDLVVLSEVQGMTELIDEKHPFIEERVKVLHSMKPLQLDDMVIGQHKSLHCYFIWVMLEYSKFSSLDSDEPFARKFNNLIHRQLAEFNYLQFKAVYRPEEYTGYAVVLFTKDGNETNPYGKYIYGWLAKEEDYKSGDPVGRFLSEKGDLKAVNDMEHDLTTRVVKDQESVYALVMTDTGSLLVSSSTERVVRVWDPGAGSKNMKMRHVVEEERNMLQLSKVWQQGLFKEPKEKQLHVSGHKWGRIETSGNMLSFNVVTSSNDKGKDMPLEEVSAVTWFPEDGHSNGEIKLPQNTPQAASVDNRKKEPNTKPTNFVENGSYTKDLDEVLVCKSQASALNISACNSTINEEPVIHSKESHKSQDEDVSKNCSQTSHNRKSANNNNYQAVATVVLEPKISRTSLCVEVEQSKAKSSGTDNIKSSKFMPSILTVGSLSSIRGGHSVTLNPSKGADESSERNAKPSERTGKEATGMKVHIWDPNYVPVQNQKKGLYVKSVQHTEIWMRNPEEITKEECAAFTELNSAKVYASPIKLQVFTFAEAYEFENLESMLQEVYAPGCVDCDAQSKNIEKWAKHFSGLDNRKSVRIEASVNEHPKWQKLSQRNVMRFFKEMLQIADVETVPTTDNSKFAAAVTHMDFLDEQFHIRAFDKEALIMTSGTGSVKESSALQFKDSFKENSVLVEHEIDAGLITTRGSFVSPVVHMAVQCKVASDLPSSLKVESAWQNLTPWKNLTICYGFPDFHT